MVGHGSAGSEVISKFVRRFVIGGCLSLSLFAFADLIEDAKVLIRESREMVVALQNTDPPPDAETVNRVQAEAVSKMRDAQIMMVKAGVRTTDDPALAYLYGDLLVRLGDVDLAAETLQNAFDLEPENADYALGYGTILTQLGEGHEKDAAQALQSAAELAEPESATAASAHAQLAEVYRQSGLYDLTLKSADRALEISPNHSGAKFLKAVCLARQGRFLESNTLMNEVATLAPVVAGDEHGRLYDAVRDFERRNLWVANTAEEHAAYAKMLIRVNRLPDSLDSLRHSVRLNPNDAIVWNLLGSVYRQANRIDEARDAFEHSLAINPDQERTRQILEQLAE